MPHSITRAGLSRFARRTAVGCLLAGSLQVSAFSQGVSAPDGTFKELTD